MPAAIRKTPPSVATTHLALLRGINLAGRNRLLMKDLAEIFANAGCSNVKTFIQSGNIVFTAEPRILKGLSARISQGIAEHSALRIPVVLRSAAEIAETIRNNPFLNAGKNSVADVRTLHVYFLADAPDASAIAMLDPLRSAPDVFQIVGRDVYLHLPNGMGRSKLTNTYFDSKLSTISTARNWNTILKLHQLMQD